MVNVVMMVYVNVNMDGSVSTVHIEDVLRAVMIMAIVIQQRVTVPVSLVIQGIFVILVQ